MELLKDHDYEIHCHPGKDNVVDDALSRKEKPIQITSAWMGIISRPQTLKGLVFVNLKERQKQAKIYRYGMSI